MYLLRRVEFPAAPLTAAQVQNAWTAAGLPQPVPAFAGSQATPGEVEDLVRRTLLAAGAMASGATGDLEVPRSSRETLERLEEFYHRLYPETRASRQAGHFQYEEVEWLGEF